MKATSLQAIVQTLNAAGVRFIVVGRLAVIAHGYLRLTHDLDLVLELDPRSIEFAFSALQSAGYRPSVPINVEQFAKPALHSQWRTEKNMEVLQFSSDNYPHTKHDVFLEHPFDFEAEWEAAKIATTGPQSTQVRFASIPSLIAMKRVAVRPKDLVDIEFLEKIQNDPQP